MQKMIEAGFFLFFFGRLIHRDVKMPVGMDFACLKRYIYIYIYICII